MKKISRLRKIKIISRLKKKIFAEWEQINPMDPNAIEIITNAMTYGFPMQIDYEGSGWRTIQPYGWNTSKDGNILLMCYKDTGEVRSYRFDRISDIYVDEDSSGMATTNNDQMNNDEQIQIYEDIMNDQQETVDYDMPTLPENNNQEIEPNIYNEELQILEDPNNEVNIIDNNINENIDNNIEEDNMEQNNIEEINEEEE